MYKLVFSKQGEKDLDRVLKSEYKTKAIEIFDIISSDPYQTPPPFERLTGEYVGYLSRRINIQHRIVYRVYGKGRSMAFHRTEFWWENSAVIENKMAYPNIFRTSFPSSTNADGTMPFICISGR
jgi:Txe/YoeB family toxin of toxin-antitoxin system